MKNLTKFILTTVTLITVVAFVVNAQTNVGGGIFANTTWTLANSPYIVVDTVVVFPGVTLTIEPGVLVKFDDHMYIEIRQANLIATGTITDSITFTSNSVSPTPGIWGHPNYGAIFFNGAPNLPSINYWNISYAITGIQTAQYLPYIKNSTFMHNVTGIGTISQTPVDSCVFKYNGTGIGSIAGNTFNNVLNFCTISNNNMGVESMNKSILNNCTIDSNNQAFGGIIGEVGDSKFHYCSISHNQNGFIASHVIGNNLLEHCVINYNAGIAIYIGLHGHDSIIDSEIKYNGTGVINQSGNTTLITHCDIEYDSIGIKLNSPAANIYCNKICNNISYGLQMGNSNNFNMANNYWCTSDSSQIAAAIYDGYDNINYGLVTFLPLDSVCYQSTGIAMNETNYFSVDVFPDPISDKLNIHVNDKTISEIILYDITARIILQQKFINSVSLNTEQLTRGLYLYEVRNKNGLCRKGKVVKD